MTMKYFWEGEGFKLFIVKHGGRVALEVKKGEGKTGALATFTKKEFSSFICEMVKYILALPEVARGIPFYESCALSFGRPHGVIHTAKVRKTKRGYVIKFPRETYNLWRRYHGLKQGDKIVQTWKEGGPLIEKPVKSKAKIIHDVRTTKKRRV